MVSIEPQRALLEEIVGDKYKVETVLAAGANPETFEPGMQTRLNLENADAYFVTGYLPFEQKLGANLSGSTKIVDTSKGITPVYGTHEHSHEHSHGDNHAHGHAHAHNADPHVWTSVRNAGVMAANMFEFLKKTDPENEEYYRGRFEALQNRLDSLDRDFSERIGSIPGNKAFAIWHPSLSYLARDYGLEQIAVGFENKEMPASTLRKVIEEARNDSVRVFFFQNEFDSRQAETLNNELGTELIIINPMDYEWEQQLERIVSALCR